MAKKKVARRTNAQKATASADLSLPQNIVLFGEQNPEDKKIYISQNTYKEIRRFTKDKTTNESGGVLLGNVVEEFGKTHIVIRAFIEAKYCEGTPTTLKFTHESWEYIHKEAAKKYPEYKILGWIHTHPDFGIFLSEYDKFIHENFFNEENQVAYVVDPIQNIEGFYFWINGKIERCKGFFLFDKTGIKITVEQETEEAADKNIEYREKNPLLRNIITAAMGVAIFSLIVICFSLHSKVNLLQNQQLALVDSANTSLDSMSLQISSLYGEIDNLKTRLAALESSESEPEQQDIEDPSKSTGAEEPTEPAETTPDVVPNVSAEESPREAAASNENGGADE